MKKIKVILTAAMLAVCGMNAQAQSLGDILSGLGKAIVGDKATTKTSIYGTWQYVGPASEFESDNFLAKAGGAAASAKVDSKLDALMNKYGMKGVSYTFNEDGTFVAQIKKATSQGTYTFDEKEKTITMKTRLGITTTAHVAVTGSEMTLLFNADKIMSGLKLVTNFTSKLNSTASLINTLAGQYDGMKVGFKLKKSSK